MAGKFRFNLSSLEYIWPTCVRCRKPVDKFEKVNLFSVDKIAFGALCHSESEVCYFDDEELQKIEDAINDGNLAEVKVFKKPVKLEHLQEV